MIGKLIVIYPSGDHRIVDAEPDLLHQLQQLVGGRVEVVRNKHGNLSVQLGDNLSNHLIAVVDEEGLLQKNFQYNGITSSVLQYTGVLVGDAVLLREGRNKDGEPDLYPLTEEDASRLSLLLQLMWSREVEE